MRHNAITGRAAAERPDINKLRPRAVVIPAYKVAATADKSGIPRAVRRGNR